MYYSFWNIIIKIERWNCYEKTIELFYNMERRWRTEGDSIISHQGMLETYLNMLGSGRNISSLKVWKIFKKSEKEEYTWKLNSFIAYGK